MEMDATTAEELDILTKWSGPGSRYVMSILCANSNNPDVALEKAWERLDFLYGSPEKTGITEEVGLSADNQMLGLYLLGQNLNNI